MVGGKKIVTRRKNSYAKRELLGKEMFGRGIVLFMEKLGKRDDHGRIKLQTKPFLCGRRSICVKS